jgi:type II secretory pathway component GspD/PulD (secretin)
MKKYITVLLVFVLTYCTSVEISTGGQIRLTYDGLRSSTEKKIRVNSEEEEKKKKLFRETIRKSAQERPGKIIWDFRDYPVENFFRYLFLNGINVAVLDRLPYEKVNIHYEGYSIKQALEKTFPLCKVSEIDRTDYSIQCLITETFKLPLTFAKTTLNIQGQTTSTGTESTGSTTGTAGSGDFTLERTFDYYSFLENEIKRLLSKDGVYSFSRAGGFLMVTDYYPNVKRIKKFIEYELANTKNIKFKVRLLRLELSKGYKYGIDWNRIISQSLLKNINISVSGTTSLDSPVLTVGGGQENFDTVIKVLEEYGKVEIIQEWEEISKGGEPAVMKRVTVYPYLASITPVQGETSTVQNPEFEEVEVGLKIIIDHFQHEDLITMNGTIDVSSVQEFKTFTLFGTSVERPVIQRDFIRFQVTLPVGNTVIVSGVKLQEEKGTNKTVPGIARIPVISWLFGYKEKERTDARYLVVITPEYTPF